MKKHITAIIAIGILVFVAMACNFTTANISDITFSKTQDGSPVTSFNTGETIYAVLTASNMPSGKYKLAWKVTYDNVAGKTKGDELGSKSLDFESSAKLWTQFTTPAPGDYKVDATLTDDTGKTIGSKSATVKVTGSSSSGGDKPDDKRKDDDN